MTWWTTHRSIVEEAAAQKSVETLSKKFDRFSEQWEGLQWLLAREPDTTSAKQEKDGVQYCLAHRKGNAQFNIPDIAAVYTFNDKEVVVLDVAAFEALDDE